jgi:hypothetical protein
MKPGMHPDMHPGVHPDMKPGMHTDMHPGMHPDTKPGMHPDRLMAERQAAAQIKSHLGRSYGDCVEIACRRQDGREG